MNVLFVSDRSNSFSSTFDIPKIVFLRLLRNQNHLNIRSEFESGLRERGRRLWHILHHRKFFSLFLSVIVKSRNHKAQKPFKVWQQLVAKRHGTRAQNGVSNCNSTTIIVSLVVFVCNDIIIFLFYTISIYAKQTD